MELFTCILLFVIIFLLGVICGSPTLRYFVGFQDNPPKQKINKSRISIR